VQSGWLGRIAVLRPTVQTEPRALSVGLSVTVVSPAKTAESIAMPFELWTRVGQRKHALHGGAHWLNLANTIESALCQIALTTSTCYYISRES